MKSWTRIAAALAVLSIALLAVGCTKPFDTTPVMVRVVTVKTQAEYNAMPNWCAGTFPNTVVERLDTKERIMIRGDCWGKVGDEFAVKQCNLHW